MKKFCFLLMISIVFIVVSGCSKQDSYFSIQDADSITLFYGIRSYSMHSRDEDIIKKISDNLNSLSFKETDKQIDGSSMFTIILSKDDESIAQVTVDANGVYWIDDTAECYEVDSGTFDYDYVKSIYK
ncbi:MAG: hypothetical protein WBI07_12730 [Mobilitalea sp.]